MVPWGYRDSEQPCARQAPCQTDLPHYASESPSERSGCQYGKEVSKATVKSVHLPVGIDVVFPVFQKKISQFADV